jgi:carbon monoxide dehydrogenase subunit G
MPIIREEISIDAPIEVVFEYVAAPENHTAMNPNIVEVTAVEDLPNGGHEADFTFQMLGRKLRGHVRDVELAPPNRRVFEVEGDVDARTTYELASENGGTRFTFVNEIDPPSLGVVGRLTGALLGRYLERNAKATLENTKMILETETAEG